LKKVNTEPNEIIRFLEGIWITRDFTINPDKEVKITEYKEVMKVKDSETITITALGIDKGKDVTRDMTIRKDGHNVILSQRDFSAKGTKRGNLVSLRGTYKNQVFDFRLYLMKDKYIYQKDVWDNNRVIEVQMSYLQRSRK
jgi:hypothetical protein